MGKISGKVSKGLGAAIQEAKAKMNGDVATNIDNTEDIESVFSQAEELLNSGVKAKRKRRTKAEMEATRDAESSEEVNDVEPHHMLTTEEVCERELQRAHAENWPDPDFDYRNFYTKGQIVFYVRVLDRLGEKEVVKVMLRSIYPRMMVGTEEKSCCHCIGYKERDLIFDTPREAQACCDSIKVSSKYAEEPKSGRKRRKGLVDDIEEENGDYEPDMSLEEAMSDED